MCAVGRGRCGARPGRHARRPAGGCPCRAWADGRPLPQSTAISTVGGGPPRRLPGRRPPVSGPSSMCCLGAPLSGIAAHFTRPPRALWTAQPRTWPSGSARNARCRDGGLFACRSPSVDKPSTAKAYGSAVMRASLGLPERCLWRAEQGDLCAAIRSSTRRGCSTGDQVIGGQAAVHAAPRETRQEGPGQGTSSACPRSACQAG